MHTVNQLVKFIDVSGDSIMITLEDGTKYYFDHQQDCCENVSIYDWKGNYHDLVGKKLLYIDSDNDDFIDETKDIYLDYSNTCTTIKFVTDENTVISRWIGSSNGYYSESVDLMILESNGGKKSYGL
jgi:frataxin-like iron-binding protein CyaY